MGKSDPNNVPNADQTHLREPKYLKADNPGPNPRPEGCTCTWTAGSAGWFRGANSRCPVSH